MKEFSGKRILNENNLNKVTGGYEPQTLMDEKHIRCPYCDTENWNTNGDCWKCHAKRDKDTRDEW